MRDNPGNKPTRLYVNFRNDEASSALSQGQPICLSCDGTEDGLAAVLPASASAAKAYALFYGIVMDQTVAVNKLGKAQVWGYCPKVKLVQVRTRAVSTDEFASIAAISSGQPFTLDTVNNGIAPIAAVAASSDIHGANLGAFMQSVASSSAVASGTGATYTASTVGTSLVKAFLRML